MHNLRPSTCCFSGYRVEKMPFAAYDIAAANALCSRLEEAVTNAAAQGFTRFFTGMSEGFDLWAAEAVLRVRQHTPLTLACAIPFERQADRYAPAWKQRFNQALLSADQVYTLSQTYYAGCYAARNRFMIDASALLICYYDGKPGGTAQTIRMARQEKLTIVNLADEQLTL